MYDTNHNIQFIKLPREIALEIHRSPYQECISLQKLIDLHVYHYQGNNQECIS